LLRPAGLTEKKNERRTADYSNDSSATHSRSMPESAFTGEILAILRRMALIISRMTVVLSILLLGAGHSFAQGSPAWSTWTGAALADSLQLQAKMPCASLVAQTGYEFSITTATFVPMPGSSQQYCRVQGMIQPDIQFEVSLPATWNGRLFMFGNGGFAGESLEAPNRVAQTLAAVSRGFAVAQTNTGHDGTAEPLATFAISRQKFLDYAYRAVHVTAVTAKRLAHLYFGSPARRAYFNGCSTGGRQGLISAQRFPDDFDGIVVGAPVLSFSGTMITYARIQRALAAAPLSAAKLNLIAEAVYAKCDASDGLKDGVIDDPRRCSFKASADLPRCTGDADGATCFSPAEIAALETIYSASASKSTPYVSGWPLGAEIGGATQTSTTVSGWVPWLIAAPGGRAVQQTFGETFFRYMAFGRPNQSYDWMRFDLDVDWEDYEQMSSTRAVLDATDPDLSRFKARGGKILSYFGWADPALNPLMGISYYERVLEKMGPSTTDFYRLFMAPGMFHCSGGVGTSAFDAVTPLIQWVEKGMAPSSHSRPQGS
jgi:feruloyl esterase